GLAGKRDGRTSLFLVVECTDCRSGPNIWLSVLLTEDLYNGQDLDGLRVVNPFTHSPDEVID
ncbi:MAG: hypothetical protein VX910_07355, partial [Candidatus Latescibacterota bacterium]|nr:hypothetical protein [Candidatus Latescibacterota bacterium]